MEWNPTQFFQSGRPSTPYAILVLNQPINQNAWDALKRNACYTICADGGANWFYELMKKQDVESVELPNAIVGDLDSIRPDVRAHYEALNVTVIQIIDQYSTDFAKCLWHLRSNKRDIVASASLESQPRKAASGTSSHMNDGDVDHDLDVVVLGGLGGRVDQAFSQIHHLYMFSQLSTPDSTRPSGRLYLVSEESISFLLQKGHSTILTPGGSKLGPGANGNKDEDRVRDHSHQHDVCLAENIGIIPISGPAAITTTGFEWDVKDWKTEFGGQLSTSNHIRADVVTVETTVPVMFTAELQEWLKFSGIRRR